MQIYHHRQLRQLLNLKGCGAFLAFPLIGISLLVFTCCGYHLRSTGEPIGIQIDTIAIPLIKSTSSQIGFEGEFTRVIREEFASHSKVPIVSRKQADAVLIVRVYGIETEVLSYSLEQDVVQGQNTTYEVTDTRRIRIKLDARLVAGPTSKIIWEDSEMEEKESFSVGTDPLANDYNQMKAVIKIARRFAQRMYLKTMERF